jgi:flavin-dependent dehydrogenase
MDDPQAGTRAAETYFQWREGDSFAFAFPTAPEGRLLILFMGHRDEVRNAREDPDGYWRRKLGEHPGVAQRIAGLDESTCTKLRSTGETPAFFRASSGPGWALAGDAGHFKDPVTGQGMRDSLWMGRTLAEHVLPVLDDPAATDAATRVWEAERDRDCLDAYHFANLDTRVERQSPALCELVRDAGRTTEPDLTDLFGRARTSYEIAPLPRLTRALVAALWRGERSRRETLRYAVRDIRTDIEMRRERSADRFRPTRTVTGSEHPGAVWPAPPPPPDVRAAPDATPTVHEEVPA